MIAMEVCEVRSVVVAALSTVPSSHQFAHKLQLPAPHLEHALTPCRSCDARDTSLAPHPFFSSSRRHRHRHEHTTLPNRHYGPLAHGSRPHGPRSYGPRPHAAHGTPVQHERTSKLVCRRDGTLLTAAQMLFTWDTTDLCIVFRSWHITNTGSLIVALLAIILLTAGYEAVREASRRYDMYASKVLEGRRGGDDLSRKSRSFRIHGMAVAPAKGRVRARAEGVCVLD
jgi:hypothetical protein